MTTSLNDRLRSARDLRQQVNDAIIENLRNELIGTVHEFTSSKWKGGATRWEESIVEGTVTSVEWDHDGEFLIKWESRDGTGAVITEGSW